MCTSLVAVLLMRKLLLPQPSNLAMLLRGGLRHAGFLKGKRNVT